MPFDDDSRDQINDFSIGIELVASGPHSDYTDDQYETLLALIASIRTRYPITAIVGHEHIAPGRKSDPGNCFDWHRIIHAHQSSGLRFPAAVLRYRV
jgi:AmpD protein